MLQSFRNKKTAAEYRRFGLSVNVNAVGSNDVRSLRNVFDFSALGIRNTVKEIEHSRNNAGVKHLKVKHHGATIDKIIGDREYFVN